LIEGTGSGIAKIISVTKFPVHIWFWQKRYRSGSATPARGQCFTVDPDKFHMDPDPDPGLPITKYGDVKYEYIDICIRYRIHVRI
jgi:hypothetical protein